MKTVKRNYRGFLAVAALATTLMMVGAGQSFADDRYHHDSNGYWDHHHQYHSYEYYHNHRGYWDERNGVRIWITI